MVAQLRADTVTAIEEIRRMVYAMRPPALDELGWSRRCDSRRSGCATATATRSRWTCPRREFPDLPAAVEVAAYRIVTEALANVARHSTEPRRRPCGSKPAADGLHLEVDRRTAAATAPGAPGSAWPRCASAPPS